MKIVGFGMDNEDGHKRITRLPGAELYDGSEASHEEMQAFFEKLSKALAERGLTVEDATQQDVEAILSQWSDAS